MVMSGQALFGAQLLGEQVPPLLPGLPCGRACPGRSPCHWGLLGPAGGLRGAGRDPQETPLQATVAHGATIAALFLLQGEVAGSHVLSKPSWYPALASGGDPVPLLACPAGSVGGLCVLGLNPGFTPNCWAELDRRWPWGCLAEED